LHPAKKGSANKIEASGEYGRKTVAKILKKYKDKNKI
jgi:hypothetical protein